MNNEKNSNKQSEIDFVGNSSFKRSVKKTKWKQFILYTFISVITLIICLVLITFGSNYLINKKIETEKEQEENLLSDTSLKGAGISSIGTRYHYGIFSATGETTIYKKIGNRKIVWDIVNKKYPAIGKVEVLGRQSGMVQLNEFNEKAQRVVRYNQLNNERIIDFYYPNISYNYLPQELEIAASLDENKLIEIAISFNKPMTLRDLGEVLGYKNVDWLWVNSTTEKQMKEIEKMDKDAHKVKDGDNAYGFGVSEGHPYADISIENTTINGAIVSGTPQDLERFQKLDIVRASVIGVTIDEY